MQTSSLVIFVFVASATLSYETLASVAGFTESKCAAPNAAYVDDFALLQTDAKAFQQKAVDMRAKRNASVDVGYYNSTREANNKDVNITAYERASETKLRQAFQQAIVDIRMKRSTSVGAGDYNITRGESNKNMNGGTAARTSEDMLGQEENQSVGENVSAMEIRENNTDVDQVNGSRGQYISRRRTVTHIYTSRRRTYHVYTSRRRRIVVATGGTYYHVHHVHSSRPYTVGIVILLIFVCCLCTIITGNCDLGLIMASLVDGLLVLR